MDCSLPGLSVHRIFQAIVLEWIAISFSNIKLRAWQTLPDTLLKLLFFFFLLFILLHYFPVSPSSIPFFLLFLPLTPLPLPPPLQQRTPLVAHMIGLGCFAPSSWQQEQRFCQHFLTSLSYIKSRKKKKSWTFPLQMGKLTSKQGQDSSEEKKKEHGSAPQY